ncbi:hypothetical protein [Mycobacterium sp. 852002-51971_SCH5477799-a]|uniref:hypothetical protein n=1 Tax=Mycobacterium sp. 852002-51971_SCH5477799-a TaxID=1834106 RepID=UPI000AA25B2B|nr:hypothetical protein [Mycobacterium sp. 852002-51971_SCH5477799-a]
MTTPSSKNRPPIFSLSIGSQGTPAPSVPRPTDVAESFQQGIGARLRGMGIGAQGEPLKELRLQLGLDMQIVYFTVHLPVAGGISLRLPVMATFKPRIYSPTQAQHLTP